MSLFGLWFLQLLLVPALSPLFIGIVRRVKARLQNRVGARVTQPYRDILKLFRKDEVVSADASWIFSSAPYLIFAVSILLGASIPLLSAHLTATVLGDLLTVVYVIALSTFFLALAGMDTGNAFGGWWGAKLSVKKGEKLIKFVLIIAIFIMAIKLLNIF